MSDDEADGAGAATSVPPPLTPAPAVELECSLEELCLALTGNITGLPKPAAWEEHKEEVD